MKQEKKAADMSARELARYIDQSVLKPEFTQDDIRRYIQDGIDVGCATVCINPASLPIAQEMCSGTDTRICVVCDFPFGLSTTESKVLQASEYCSKYDVFELDIVSNFGWIRSGLWDKVRDDIAAVCNVCHEYGVAVKTIFETDALTLPQILQATDVAIEAGTDFVKTSTGFYTGSVNYSPDGKCVGRLNRAYRGDNKARKRSLQGEGKRRNSHKGAFPESHRYGHRPYGHWLQVPACGAWYKLSAGWHGLYMSRWLQLGRGWLNP